MFVLIFVCFFVLVVVLYCIFYITVKFQDASCPSLDVGVLSSSVEPPSQSLAVSMCFFTSGLTGLLFPLA